MTPIPPALQPALGALVDPYSGRPVAESVRGAAIDGDRVAVEIQLGYPAAGWHAALTGQVRDAIEALPGIARATVSVTSRVHAHRVQKDLTPLPEVKNIIAVASGKGGVGKSIEPKVGHGLQAMSIGLLIDEDTPMIWRGPMVTQALQQLLNDTRWKGLDYLVIDLPPGTGDIQLTLAQRVPVSGAVVVTTPLDIATLDARKALQMFGKVEVPVLGIVENMAVHVCSACGHAEHVFGAGGGERMAAQYGVPLLGSLPLDIRIREQADSGTPTVAAAPDSPLALAYRDIARRTAARLAQQARNKSIAMPGIVISNT